METMVGGVIGIACIGSWLYLFITALYRGEGGWAAALFFFWPLGVPLYIIHLIRTPTPAKSHQTADDGDRYEIIFTMNNGNEFTRSGDAEGNPLRSKYPAFPNIVTRNWL
jgi:hypothetical protein